MISITPTSKVKFGFFVFLFVVLTFNYSWASNNHELNKIKLSAENGDLQAQYLLGSLYYYGEVVKRVQEINYKRVLTCQVISGISGVCGDQITCEGNSGLFSNKISDCRSKVEWFACHYAWGCNSGIYYCDSETMFVNEDPQVVINKICK